jgi:peptidoglycan/xylan/chitin deacetylase (PgdA/CDA1 family)
MVIYFKIRGSDIERSEIQMRKLLPVILVSIIFFSCAGFRAGRIRDKPPPQAGDVPVTVPAVDRIKNMVKADSKEIEKYFITDENGVITVKADFREGNTEFEILYDLSAPARSSSPEDPLEFPHSGDSLWVGFSVINKQTGEKQEDSFRWPIREDAAGLLLAFDDDYRQAWEDSFDILEKYGARVTYFVQGELSDFCFHALNRGHDIGYHTMHHLNLPQVSERKFYIETTSDIGSFREAGIPLRTFAYPFGLSEPWMRETLADTFAIQRGFGVTFRLYTREAVRKGYIISRSIDNTLFKEDAVFAAMITGMFRTLRFIGGDHVLPITTHDISDTAHWGIKPRRLEYLLTAANFFKLKFYCYADFVDS